MTDANGQPLNVGNPVKHYCGSAVLTVEELGSEMAYCRGTDLVSDRVFRAWIHPSELVPADPVAALPDDWTARTTENPTEDAT